MRLSWIKPAVHIGVVDNLWYKARLAGVINFMSAKFTFVLSHTRIGTFVGVPAKGRQMGYVEA